MRRDGTHPARPAGGRRLFREEPDGNLYDLDKRCLVSPTELGDALAAGATFRAYRHDTGADCTYEILLKLLALHPLTAIGAGSRELITTDAAVEASVQRAVLGRPMRSGRTRFPADRSDADGGWAY
ncbi:hypothetical protein [Allorhizocola rhizosphaerae]|uniref:hypothetical protein n=1 Tax=Allorhizocola rhizosphaerae TaxID=1872709 RepID=UPI000E3D2DAB|nr:hypothetical protein [Allorhizocola rhizosphaerae]